MVQCFWARQPSHSAFGDKRRRAHLLLPASKSLTHSTVRPQAGGGEKDSRFSCCLQRCEEKKKECMKLTMKDNSPETWRKCGRPVFAHAYMPHDCHLITRHIHLYRLVQLETKHSQLILPVSSLVLLATLFLHFSVVCKSPGVLSEGEEEMWLKRPVKAQARKNHCCFAYSFINDNPCICMITFTEPL